MRIGGRARHKTLILIKKLNCSAELRYAGAVQYLAEDFAGYGQRYISASGGRRRGEHSKRCDRRSEFFTRQARPQSYLPSASPRSRPPDAPEGRPGRTKRPSYDVTVN